MEKSPLVSILIVNYNTKDLLLDCISSIKKYVKCDYEIIIVDNASRDGSVEALPKNVHVIRNKTNVGFARANNQAAAKAKGKYVLLLNSDTYLTDDAVSVVAQRMDENPRIGVSSCRLTNTEGSLQPTGGFFPTPWRLFMWMFFVDDLPLLGKLLKPFHPNVSFYKGDTELDWVTGAFFMVRRKKYISLGGLDEEYFMYTEEMDFCFRMKKKGSSIAYFHAPSIVHLGQASSTNENAIVSEIKNLVLFYKKHLPLRVSYARVVLKGGSLIRAFIYAILGKKTQKTIYEKAFQSI